VWGKFAVDSPLEGDGFEPSVLRWSSVRLAAAAMQPETSWSLLPSHEIRAAKDQGGAQFNRCLADGVAHLAGEGRAENLLEELLRRQIARLPPIEDRLGDIRLEIAEADETREMGPADPFPLDEYSKGDCLRPGRKMAPAPVRVMASRPTLMPLPLAAAEAGDRSPGAGG
jgi:hypothetical protein